MYILQDSAQLKEAHVHFIDSTQLKRAHVHFRTTQPKASNSGLQRFLTSSPKNKLIGLIYEHAAYKDSILRILSLTYAAY
jgi:hypothetical protein